VLRLNTLPSRETIDTRHPGLSQHPPVVHPGCNDIETQSRSSGQGFECTQLAAHLPKYSTRSAGTTGFGRQGAFLASDSGCTTKRRDAHANLSLVSPAFLLQHKITASLSFPQHFVSTPVSIVLRYNSGCPSYRYSYETSIRLDCAWTSDLTMRASSFFAPLFFAASSLAQAVPEGIEPSSPAPDGCETTVEGKFTIGVENFFSAKSKRETAQEVRTITHFCTCIANISITGF
jgi:hypothetical protein